MALSFRTLCLTGFLACAGLMGFALYAQYALHLDPCPLCIFQRMAVCAMGLGFAAGSLLGPARKGRLVVCAWVCLGAVWGMITAGRHLWLQSLPASEVPACGPGLGYLFDAFPFFKMLRLAFTGSGECARIEPVLGLPMPVWTLVWFVGLSVLVLAATFRRRP
jgi:disulfide bond formation protein DsbB